jgi:hypothetical protein
MPTPQRRDVWPHGNGLAGNSSICHRPAGRARYLGLDLLDVVHVDDRFLAVAADAEHR